MSSTAVPNITDLPKPPLRQRVRAKLSRIPKPVVYVAASAAAGGVAAYVGANDNARDFLTEKAHEAGDKVSDLTSSDSEE